jgi:hypothetical protein
MKHVLNLIQRHWVLLCFLLLIGLVVRLYKIDTPLADWHSWRQADTASVTREYVKHNYPLLLSHYHDLSDIPNGLNNVDGYRMVEFPIVNYLVAQVIRQHPQFDLVVTSRLFSVGFSLISLIALYSIVWQLSGKKLLAFLSTAVYAVLPYVVFYSRVILPEPAMIMTQLVSLASFIAWINSDQGKTLSFKRWGFYLLSVVSFAMALLFKPMAIFIAPVFVIIAFWKLGLNVFKKWELWVFPILTLIPLWLWRQWIVRYPSGIPASSWLFNGNGIRLRPAWWRWLFADRLGRLILGYWGTVLLAFGVIAREGKQKLSLFDVTSIVWTLSMILYLVVIATGNVQHDYYQVMLVPIICILVGRGIWWMMTQLPKVASPWVVYPTLLLILFLTAQFSWYEVKGYYNINNPAIVKAGQRIDQVTPADAKVIAPYQGDTAFLFQTNRTGWPIGGRIEEKINLGAKYYVSTAYDDEAKELEKKYTLIEKNADFVIIELQKNR